MKVILLFGNYKYHYKEVTIENENSKTTKKVFESEELVGEKYERLKEYLKNNLQISQDEIETDTQIIIQAANGYSENEEKISWLQESQSSLEIITDGKGLIPTRNVYLAYTRLYNNNIRVWNENTSYLWWK